MEEVNAMTTVTVDENGKIGLPEEVLKQSHIKPGMELIVVADAGKITLLNRQQALRERMKKVDQEIRARLREALQAGGRESFFAGLNLDEYLALSEEEERALWDRLYQEAEAEVEPVEQEIPSHFRPAGQRHGARSPARRPAR